MSSRGYSESILAYAQGALNGMFLSAASFTGREGVTDAKVSVSTKPDEEKADDAGSDIDVIQEEEDFEGSDASGWTQESWIQSFLSMEGNEFFTDVSDDFLMDDFNLTGLSGLVPNYQQALQILQDSDYEEAGATEDEQLALDRSCMELYGLIHARFIVTARGLAAMSEKFQSGHFGYCPRVLCQNQHVLPVGTTDVPRRDTVKLFCPRCEEIYNPSSRRHSRIDGAYFGTTFPHLFLQTYPQHIHSKSAPKYVPRIFGFKIHASSKDRLTTFHERNEKQSAPKPPSGNNAISGSSTSMTNDAGTLQKGSALDKQAVSALQDLTIVESSGNN